ncbi:putative integral membrane protein [Candida parapsilosis]|uniref:Autophagy-related protein 33 n=2 Tax=Candida parapsilosis TaxID=5480 RepID=G8BJX1_CANPC|nr:uncharacterized protein CPAR2_407390 [Candida parapsilosis]KAF6045688.1 putative integral membrane protein [Candida parapsilosis]KAF6046759.1 hypothetical protein FOB59_004224 [Candida parapsilosis]KAF6050800.1 putative integral membrane protein [Candida parapsilosis]KAF6062478.1 putative integral membrane protein [Candida parapsilosis]KAI5910438.1 hypothetical protein K4G61_g4137 [Candida parapsilosis]
MTGTCVNTIKLLGLGSLGLLTSSLIQQSVQNIPNLITQLNAIYSLNVITLNSKITEVKSYLFSSRVVNGLLTGLSTLFFTLAYKYSPIDEKHPYLVYAAIGAPLTLFGLYYKAWGYEDKILSKQDVSVFKKGSSSKTSSHAPSSVVSVDDDEDEPQVISKVSSVDELGRSYVHLSDESGLSTPTSSQPASPQIRHQEGDRDVEDEQQQQQQQQPREGTSAQEAEVEIEIENTLTKKEIVQDLKHIKSGYTIGSYVSGLSLTIAVVGLFGDFYLL